MITSLIEMLELSDFRHRGRFTIEFESRDKVLFVTWWQAKIMTSWTIIQILFLYFKEAWSSQFCSYHQNCNQLIKTTFKDWIKVRLPRKRLSLIGLRTHFFGIVNYIVTLFSLLKCLRHKTKIIQRCLVAVMKNLKKPKHPLMWTFLRKKKEPDHGVFLRVLWIFQVSSTVKHLCTTALCDRHIWEIVLENSF